MKQNTKTAKQKEKQQKKEKKQSKTQPTKRHTNKHSLLYIPSVSCLPSNVYVCVYVCVLIVFKQEMQAKVNQNKNRIKRNIPVHIYIYANKQKQHDSNRTQRHSNQWIMQRMHNSNKSLCLESVYRIWRPTTFQPHYKQESVTI